MSRKLDYFRGDKSSRGRGSDKWLLVAVTILLIIALNAILIYRAKIETGWGRMFVAVIAVPVANVPLIVATLAVAIFKPRMSESETGIAFFRTMMIGVIVAVLLDEYAVLKMM